MGGTLDIARLQLVELGLSDAPAPPSVCVFPTRSGVLDSLKSGCEEMMRQEARIGDRERLQHIFQGTSGILNADGRGARRGAGRDIHSMLEL